MIKIDLKLFVSLSTYLPPGSDQYEIPEGTTVDKLIRDLDIPDDLVKLIFVNSVRQERDCVLKNNDRVGLFPPVGGG